MKNLKKYRILLIVVLLLLIVTLGIMFYPFVIKSNDQIIDNYFLSSENDKGSLVAVNYFKNKPAENTLIITKFDLINPTYSLVYNYSKSSLSNYDIYSVYVFHLKRTGILSYSVSDKINVTIKNKPFSEAVALAQKYDLSKENPDPQNITVFVPLQPSSNTQPIVYPEVTIPIQQ